MTIPKLKNNPLISASLVIILAGVIVLLVSCNESTDERSHPLYIKASQTRARGEYPEAVALYKQYLIKNPVSAKTHKELATLYDDHLDDNFNAIIHYRRFLEYAPENSEDLENFQKWLDNAEREYFEELKNKFGETTQITDLNKKVGVLEEKNQRYLTAFRKIKKQNQLLKDRLFPNWKKYRQGGGKDQEKLETGDPQNQKMRYYVVQKGDNLAGIARKLYGSTKYYQFIFDSNRDVLKSESSLEIGQKLRIPPLPNKKESLP